MKIAKISVSVIVPEYRNAAGAIALCEWLAGLPSTQLALETIVIDDGSGDDTSDWIEARLPSCARLLRLPCNLGRARARNVGAGLAQGEFLLFLDSDCRPAEECFVAIHQARLKAGAIASTGPVIGCGAGFWHDYQVRSSARRAAQYARGAVYAGSTANLMAHRAAFWRVGGFDESYRGYGFEDRDLLIRLSKLGPIAWVSDAIVEHHDALDVATVARKMQAAGAGGAAIFRERHPEAYRELGYSQIDGSLHRSWRALRPLLQPLQSLAIDVADRMIGRDWVPFKLNAGLVRGVSALSFLLGTLEVDRNGVISD